MLLKGACVMNKIEGRRVSKKLECLLLLVFDLQRHNSDYELKNIIIRQGVMLRVMNSGSVKESRCSPCRIQEDSGRYVYVHI